MTGLEEYITGLRGVAKGFNRRATKQGEQILVSE